MYKGNFDTYISLTVFIINMHAYLGFNLNTAQKTTELNDEPLYRFHNNE